MHYYLKAMYDAWCNGQEDGVGVCMERFIHFAANQLHRSEDEIREYLNRQPWFDKPILYD